MCAEAAGPEGPVKIQDPPLVQPPPKPAWTAALNMSPISASSGAPQAQAVPASAKASFDVPHLHSAMVHVAPPIEGDLGDVLCQAQLPNLPADKLGGTLRKSVCSVLRAAAWRHATNMQTVTTRGAYCVAASAAVELLPYLWCECGSRRECAAHRVIDDLQ